MSLQIRNLRKSYQQGEQKIDVLKGLEVDIPDGRLVSILGRSGSGKSTLLSLLAGLESADHGEILVDGKDLVSMSEKDLTAFRAQKISLVFQQYHLVSHLSALENVTLPLEILGRPNGEEKATALLTELGLGHRLHHTPGQLSGGECQRVAIARALVVEPKVLLADEPSGNLDVHTGDKVMDLFFEIAKKHKITTVLVTHSESLARRCEKSYRLDEGVFTEV
ncbi:MAG: ABC transporter ATP-binding protein [Bdellovibrionaceae bacterium]|nr:ABC transporter ATP-binding protein [Pseudobdellovibrionaceae bacterium]